MSLPVGPWITRGRSDASSERAGVDTREYATRPVFPHNYPQLWTNDTGVAPSPSAACAFVPSDVTSNSVNTVPTSSDTVHTGSRRTLSFGVGAVTSPSLRVAALPPPGKNHHRAGDEPAPAGGEISTPGGPQQGERSTLFAPSFSGVRFEVRHSALRGRSIGGLTRYPAVSTLERSPAALLCGMRIRPWRPRGWPPELEFTELATISTPSTPVRASTYRGVSPWPRASGRSSRTTVVVHACTASVCACAPGPAARSCPLGAPRAARPSRPDSPRRTHRHPSGAVIGGSGVT